VSKSGVQEVNTIYKWMSAKTIPPGFAKVCEQNNWNTTQMWKQLNGDRNWLRAEDNDSYMYWNSADSQWWIDEPNGLGVFVAPTSNWKSPPVDGWISLRSEYRPLPQVELLGSELEEK